MTSLKVSILIPVYNREKYISECIQSALDQTYEDFEIILVDNASTDRTWEICNEYAARDTRLRVFRNQENIGPVRNWLECVKHAKGIYTKILWSDDLIHPYFLELLVPALNDSSIGFVYSSFEIFEGEKRKFKRVNQCDESVHTYSTSKYINGMLLGEGNFPYSPGCALFRTKDVQKNLLLDVPNRVNSDFSMHAIGNDLLLFLLTAQQYKKYVVIDEPLSCFRAHSDSITTSAPSGKILLHYDLAKGFFAERFVHDDAVLKKLNTVFWLHLKKYDAGKYGIRSIKDFYPIYIPKKISFLFLLGTIINKFLKRLGVSG